MPADIGEPQLAVRMWEPERAGRARKWRKAVALGVLLIVAAGALIPTAAFPTFSVTMYPKVETVETKGISLTASTAATVPDPATRRIPALAIEVEQAIGEEFSASGTRHVEERARGNVLISNSFSSSPQALVTNTRLQDPTGKIFRLARGVVVPGAKVENGRIVPTSIAADIVADAAGEAYNIGPTAFSIPGFRGTPKYQGFSARSERPFTGGFSGEARVVEPTDLAAASETLTRRIVEEIGNALQAKVPPEGDFLAPEGAREIAVVKIDQPRAGERMERFTVSVSARGRTTVLRRDDIMGVLAATLLPAEANLPLKAASGQSDLVFGGAVRGPSAGELRFSASGSLAYWRETNLSDLERALRASTPRKAEAYLRSREEIESFRIKRFPRWLWFIPKRAQGLRLEIEAPL